MRYNDLINEADSGVDEYQQLQNFMKANQTPGVPPDQQVALALFRELKRTQQHNQQLDAELKAAEQRIDVATQGSEMQKQALGKHQAELEKERGDIEQQQAAMGKLDKTYAERDMASKAQIKDLTNRLEQVKSKPGVDPKATNRLEKEIEDLKKNGISADKVANLEQSIAAVQQMHQVDDKSINDLMAKVNAAQEKAQELEKTKQSMGQELDKATTDAQNQIDQIKQQLAHFREVEKTVSALQPIVTDVIAPKVDKLVRAQDLTDKINNIKTAKKVRDEIVAGVPNMRAQQPAPAPAPDPQMSLPGVNESQLLKAIKWATKK